MARNSLVVNVGAGTPAPVVGVEEKGMTVEEAIVVAMVEMVAVGMAVVGMVEVDEERAVAIDKHHT
ncbi:hypothetical protein FRC06_004455, partial [Ceratobasidium sp. 370]